MLASGSDPSANVNLVAGETVAGGGACDASEDLADVVAVRQRATLWPDLRSPGASLTCSAALAAKPACGSWPNVPVPEERLATITHTFRHIF